MGGPQTDDDVEDLDDSDLESEVGPAGQRALDRLLAKVSEVTEQQDLSTTSGTPPKSATPPAAVAPAAEPWREVPAPTSPEPSPVPTAFSFREAAAVGFVPDASPRPLDMEPRSPHSANVVRPAARRSGRAVLVTALVLLCGVACVIGYRMMGGAESPATPTTAAPESQRWRSLLASPVSTGPASAEPAVPTPVPETARVRDLRSEGRRRAPAVEQKRAEPKRPPRQQTDDPFALRPRRSVAPGGP